MALEFLRSLEDVPSAALIYLDENVELKADIRKAVVLELLWRKQEIDAWQERRRCRRGPKKT